MHRVIVTASRRLSPLKPLLLLVLLLPLAQLLAPRVDGRPDGPGRRPVLVGPDEGEVVVESALKFAFAPPPGFGHPILLYSHEPFSTDGLWSDRTSGNVVLPPGSPVKAVPVSGTIVDGTPLGITASHEDWYWAVVSRDDAGGMLSVSDVRRFHVVPAYQVSSPVSPLVRGETRGTLSPEDLEVVRPKSRRLHLTAGYDFETDGAEPALTTLEKTPIPVGVDEREALIVQFDSAPTEADRAALLAAGAIPVSPVPDQAWLVRAFPESRERIAGLDHVAWTGDWAPAYRVSPSIREAAAAPASAGAPVEMTVLLFADAPLIKERDRLVGLGAAITQQSDNGINRLLRVKLPPALALSAARLPGVQWIEPWITPTVENDNAQWVVQTNLNGNRRVWDMGIDGTGQIVNNTDSGITVTHDQFRDPAVPITTFGDFPTHRKIIAYHRGSNNPAITFGDHSGASFHGTHTNGTVAGNDGPVGGASLRDGMAKGAKIFFQDLSGTTLANSIDHFPDLNDLYQDAYNGNSAGAPRISTNSWGSNTGGAYDVSCMQIDQFMWAHKDFLIFFSNGNASSTNTVGSPASAKDCCSAGGTQNGTSASNIYSSTSRGPTDDNRRKPTVCSPGQSIFSADGNTTSGYKSLSGTSMASPTQTGAAVLMRQYLTDGWYPTGAPVPANGFTPSAALLKAMVVNSADNGVTGFTAPDNNIGYGRVMADNVLYFSGDTRRLIAIDNQPGLGQGDYIEYQIQVTSSAIPLEVTLCWTDYPASPASAIQLVNDLNLSVSKGVTTYKGNVYSGGVSITGGSFDNRNVEEACLINSPATGTWTVRVEGVAIPAGPQPYGLVVTGAVDGGSGALYLDRAEYGSTATMQVKVVDTNASAPFTVHINSTTEAAGEDVTMTGGNGIFTGTLRLAPWTPGAPHSIAALAPRAVDVADDTLRVSHGDLLTATYNDASPVASLIAKASVAIEQPTITGVNADSRGSSGAVIKWNTDLNSTSKVYWGATPALELGSLTDGTAVLAHQLVISGLTTGATYYYDVESSGLNGNTVRDTNGGSHYRVTIEPPADILLLVGDETSFDRTECWEEAAADAGWSLDIWTDALADSALLGNKTGGLRSYKTVIWQAGFNQYPPFSDTQRARISVYLAGGGRLLTVGHDIGWAFGDPTSPVYSATRQTWLHDILHTTFQADPTTWSSVIGYASDPISGAYTGGVSYTPLGSNQAGDEVDFFAGAGTANYTWKNNETTPDDIGFRWLSNSNNGSPDSAVWGGQPSRLATMYFEYTAINPPFTTPNAARTDILDKTLIWLIGRDRPDAALTFPTTGGTVTADSINVAWTEASSGGTLIARRRLEYSTDGGDSWTLMADSVGVSPYRWNVTGIPNGTALRVRIRVTDNGSPSLSGTGQTSGNFSLLRPGGDHDGPLVVAGSPAASPNPLVAARSGALTARITDTARGGLNVTAAEWSRGTSPATAGSGTPMSGVFTSPTVDVSYNLDGSLTRYFPAGPCTLWVRGRDSAGNWGPATSLRVQVNPGMFARGDMICPAPGTVLPGGATALAIRARNIGPGADTLHVRVTVASAAAGLTLIGAPVNAEQSVAPGDTMTVPVNVAAAPTTVDGAVISLRCIVWPIDEPGDADTCFATVTARRSHVSVACHADTVVTSPVTFPLTFAVGNTGSLGDSIRWQVTDLGPGPNIHLNGGPVSGVTYVAGGGGPIALPAVTIEAEAAAAAGQQTTLRIIAHADFDSTELDTCSVLVYVGTASSVPDIRTPAVVFAAGPALPNPFHQSARIHFSLPKAGHAQLRLHAADGRLVRTLVNGDFSAGAHDVDWDGRDDGGSSVPSGIYFYRLSDERGESAVGRVLKVN